MSEGETAQKPALLPLAQRLLGLLLTAPQHAIDIARERLLKACRAVDIMVLLAWMGESTW
jgi:hypothetical protein